MIFAEVELAAWFALAPFFFRISVSSRTFYAGWLAGTTSVNGARLIEATGRKALRTSNGGFLNRCMLPAVALPECT
jgi:hypothetical protein